MAIHDLFHIMVSTILLTTAVLGEWLNLLIMKLLNMAKRELIFKCF